ncbi:hypothetical protein V8F33_010891 [Rhypophila sp. PSN 637]
MPSLPQGFKISSPAYVSCIITSGVECPPMPLVKLVVSYFLVLFFLLFSQPFGLLTTCQLLAHLLATCTLAQFHLLTSSVIYSFNNVSHHFSPLYLQHLQYYPVNAAYCLDR